MFVPFGFDAVGVFVDEEIKFESVVLDTADFVFNDFIDLGSVCEEEE